MQPNISPTALSTEEPAGARGGTLLLSAVVAALGSFLFGFDTAVISGTTESLQTVFKLSNFFLGFTVSSALIGTMVGSLLAGRPADRWGRRPVLALVRAIILPLVRGSRRRQRFGSMPDVYH
jgi:MFS family permease